MYSLAAFSCFVASNALIRNDPLPCNTRNDRRLMQEIPGILAISNALEARAGQYISYGAVCGGAVVATTLAGMRYSQAAILVASGGFMCLIVSAELIIWRCALSLLHTIDKSLQKSLPAGNASPTVKEGKAKEGKEGGLDLVGAKKKVERALSFSLSMSVQTLIMLMFSSVSKYGVAVPLIMFGIPMGFAPLIWHAFFIQLHAGRSKPKPSRGLVSGVSINSELHKVESPQTKRSYLRSNYQIAPTEGPAEP